MKRSQLQPDVVYYWASGRSWLTGNPKARGKAVSVVHTKPVWRDWTTGEILDSTTTPGVIGSGVLVNHLDDDRNILTTDVVQCQEIRGLWNELLPRVLAREALFQQEVVTVEYTLNRLRRAGISHATPHGDGIVLSLEAVNQLLNQKGAVDD